MDCEKVEMSEISDECWTRVRGRLRAEVGEAVYSSWFARMELESVEANTARISVPTLFLKSWIQSHYVELLLTCWQSERPTVTQIDLSVRPAPARSAQAFATTPPAAVAHLEKRETSHFRPKIKSISPPSPVPQGARGGSPLDSRLTFESFVVGRSNTLAHAASKQVATARRGDPVMFNPLYIHSGVGLGKTHLLQAVALKTNSLGERKALYLTAERFMYGFASALRSQTALAFKDALRGIDVLVVDDLQFLQGKNSQAEFSHTLNSLIDGGRQVVVAADRPPTELESLDERIRSRLAGGLAVEIGLLGEELRLEILSARVQAARAHHPGFDVPPQVLGYIARTVTHNGRDLEGALNRLLAHSKLTGQPITMELAERELRDLIRPMELKRVRIEEIQRIVARHYNVSRSDLLSSRRTANVVRPRQIAMYLAKTLTLRSLPEIGRRFGGRDHTTVLHAVRKIESLIGVDNTLAAEIEVLKGQLQE
jgi:chromosomal replication initiator protein